MNQFIIAGVGYDDLQAGEGNTLYQLAAAVVGVGLGSKCKREADLQRVLHVLHIAMMVGVAGLGALCWAVNNGAAGSAVGSGSSASGAGGQDGRQLFAGAVAGMLLIMTLLGGTLMGMLPFCLQQACYTVAPASENVVSGLIYFIAMVVAASLTQLMSVIAPMSSVELVVALISVEFCMFAFCCQVPPSYASEADSGAKVLLLGGRAPPP